jgi:hypothetical protein
MKSYKQLVEACDHCHCKKCQCSDVEKAQRKEYDDQSKAFAKDRKALAKEKAVAYTESVEVNELSTDLLTSYKEKAGQQASSADAGATGALKANSPSGNALAKRLHDLSNKRYKGINTATKKQFANDSKLTPQHESVFDWKNDKSPNKSVTKTKTGLVHKAKEPMDNDDDFKTEVGFDRKMEKMKKP